MYSNLLQNHSDSSDLSQKKIILLTDTAYPRLEVTFGGADSIRPSIEIDAEEFIAVKGFKAKGKRISTFTIDTVTELEPVRFPEIPEPEHHEAEATQIEESDQDGQNLKQSPKVVQGDLFAFDENDQDNKDSSFIKQQND